MLKFTVAMTNKIKQKQCAILSLLDLLLLHSDFIIVFGD